MDRTSAVLDELRSRGHRVTHQRRAIIEEIYSRDGHISPGDIYRALSDRTPGVNESTVYRTVELLHEAGFLARSHLGVGDAGYHHSERHDHVHLICSNCLKKDILPLDEAAGLRDELIRRKGFHADLRQFAIAGLCSECAAASASE